MRATDVNQTGNNLYFESNVKVSKFEGVCTIYVDGKGLLAVAI